MFVYSYVESPGALAGYHQDQSGWQTSMTWNLLLTGTSGARNYHAASALVDTKQNDNWITKAIHLDCKYNSNVNVVLCSGLVS